MAVQLSTGELTEALPCYLPVGTICYTPESQEAYRKRKEREEKRFLKRGASDELGYFFFVLASEQFSDLSPEMVTRLIFLNTFAGYDNRLMLTERTPMRRKNLESVMDVSKSTVKRFWKKVCPNYIKEDKNGLMITNNLIFKKNKLQRKEYIPYQKFYIESVRKLYSTTDTSNHKHLGYIFKLLPFINIEYNLICRNPLETDIDQIELISIADFCNMIGFNIVHLNRLLRIYNNIRFDVNGRAERFCTIIYDGIHKNNAKICINPRILFSGSDYRKVEVLGAFYRD